MAPGHRVLCSKMKYTKNLLLQNCLARVLEIYYVALPDGLSSKPGSVAQSVGHLTHKSEVLGSIPGLAIYFRFFFR